MGRKKAPIYFYYYKETKKKRLDLEVQLKYDMMGI